MKKALYRRFRPQTFDEVYDQGSVTAVLKNQVKTKNIGHAYLFSGTRGTGKTSCAKIFARAVNCLHPVNGNPCNECENCRAILDETTMDVVEMDAASNRRIDDIRELRDKVIYPPATLKYKVYIIDEAHMITKEAFNALLKIMEEPPAHLIFILATTEIDSIPITILSRTQRYEFKRIELGAIEENLKRIALETEVEISDEACHSLAIMADGAMRDALSLFDQVIAGEQKVITQETIDKILGTVGFDRVYNLMKFIFENDSKSALTYIEEIFGDGKDAAVLLKEMLEYFRKLLIFKTTEDESFLKMNSEQNKLIGELIKDVPVQRILDSIEILLYADEQIKKSDYAEILLEAAIVRLVNFVSDKDMVSRLEAVEAKTMAIERWQIPENMILREVREYLKSWDIGETISHSKAIQRIEKESVESMVKDTETMSGETVAEDMKTVSGETAAEDMKTVSGEIAAEDMETVSDKKSISEKANSDIKHTDAEESIDIIPKEAQAKEDINYSEAVTNNLENDFIESEICKDNKDNKDNSDNEFAFFEDSPKEWLQDHKEQLFSEFENIGVRGEFFSNYKRVILKGNVLTFIFPETYGFVAKMISIHAAEMENIFHKAIGKRYSIRFCPESEARDLEEITDKAESNKGASDKKRETASAIEKKNAVEDISNSENKDEVLEKLKEAIPNDILNLVDGN